MTIAKVVRVDIVGGVFEAVVAVNRGLLMAGRGSHGLELVCTAYDERQGKIGSCRVALGNLRVIGLIDRLRVLVAVPMGRLPQPPVAALVEIVMRDGDGDYRVDDPETTLLGPA